MNFHVGQKVVYIGGGSRNPDYAFDAVSYAEKGVVYTIRGMFTCEVGQYTCLLLQEIVNPQMRTSQGICEPGFHIKYFRPVCETSIEIFRAMLVTPPKEVVEA